MPDLVQSLDRRGVLRLAAAAVAATSCASMAQTLIADAPTSGAGFVRDESQPPASAPEVRISSPAASAALTDWRQLLLAGERSILLRCDGGAMHVRYCTADGLLDRGGYAQACYLLRDVQAGRVFPIDPQLLDVLCGIQRWGEHNGRGSPFHVLSGFRTDATNARTEGAARNSMHRYGKAADGYLEGFSSGLLGAMVRQFNSQGGTGIYLSRGFVHVDTGAARSWISTARR